MISNELYDEYFRWICQLVCNETYFRSLSYRKLLYSLHNIVFTYTIPMDENRAIDGIDLRYRFGYEQGYSTKNIEDSLDDFPCSVLEMMVALSVRCEENIMDDSSVGNRTGQWFWSMIVNLGLGQMTDQRFDHDTVMIAVNRLETHTYSKDGSGGLFTVTGTDKDMRKVEIWYQMCWYLDQLIG